MKIQFQIESNYNGELSLEAGWSYEQLLAVFSQVEVMQLMAGDTIGNDACKYRISAVSGN